MAHLGFVLSLGPYQFQNWETVYNLSRAALKKEHRVSIFLYLDGVYNVIKHQTFPDYPVLPKDKFAELKNSGAEILACGLCTNARGLQSGKEFIEGMRVAGLPDFAEILGKVDKLVAL